jgi:hypothetical protein
MNVSHETTKSLPCSGFTPADNFPSTRNPTYNPMNSKKLLAMLLIFGAFFVARSAYAYEYDGADEYGYDQYDDDPYDGIDPNCWAPEFGMDVDGNNPDTFDWDGYYNWCDENGIDPGNGYLDFGSYGDFWDWVNSYGNGNGGTGSEDGYPNSQIVLSGGSNPTGEIDNGETLSILRTNGMEGKAVTNQNPDVGLNLNLYNQSDPQHGLVGITPFNGAYYTIGSHGNPISIQLPNGTAISAIDFAQELQNNPSLHYTSGSPIWLIGCNTGASVSSGNNFAQDLANALGVTVMAPTTDTFTDSNGQISLAPGGTYMSFSPNP